MKKNKELQSYKFISYNEDEFNFITARLSASQFDYDCHYYNVRRPGMRFVIETASQDCAAHIEAIWREYADLRLELGALLSGVAYD